MSKFIFYIQLLFGLYCALCAPQDGGNTDYESDYPRKDCGSNEVCVPFYLCQDGEIVIDGSHLLDPRKKPNEEEQPPDDTYNPSQCTVPDVCCRNSEASTIRPYESRCGIRNPGGITGRVLSAHATGEAEFGEWPWQAAILKTDGSKFIFKCGGTLIDEKHVLTIAHCADQLDKKNIVVRLGEWDTQNADEFLQFEDYDVSEIFIHPQFRSNNLYNDIAILELERDVTYKEHIDTVCLPRDDDDFTGQDCIVTGWGTNAYKNGTFSTILKEVSVPIISNAECQKKLRKTRLGKVFKLHGSFMCAGGEEGNDACKGDGGGPLVCLSSDSTYTVAGLVSWGIECGHTEVPGVYVNVKKFIDWITSITGKELPQYWSS